MTFQMKLLNGCIEKVSWVPKKPIVGIFVELIQQSGSKIIQIINFSIKIQVPKNEFLIEIYENLDVVCKMYISEISKSKISGHKSQKMTI